MKRGIIVVLVLGVMFGTASIASAQVRTTGVIQGRTMDQDGVPLPGVMITVNSPSLMGTQTVYSGSDGAFRVPLLPRGSYTVTFALQGFMTIIREEVDVGVQRTTSLEAEMALSSTEETITVTGRSPLVDVRSTKRSSDYSDELRNALPEARGVGGDFMNYAPEATPSGGSTSASGANFFGDNSTAYMVDGVTVTDPSGGSQFPFYSPDFFDVVELTSIGGSADMGKFQGVAFNVVTKSGGNEFHGEGNFFYQNNSFINDNTEGINQQICPDDPTCFEPPTIQYRYDGTFSIGGPMLQDKAWFFTSYQAFYEQDTRAGVSYPLTEDSDRFLGKVTWQVSDNNRIIGSVMSDTYTLYGRPSSSSRTYDQTGLEPSMNITPNITWNSVLSPDSFLEVKYSGFYGYFDLIPFVDLPQTVEDTTGIVTGGLDGHFAADRSRSGVQASLSHFAEDFAGDHAFKFGAEWERNTLANTWQYNANLAPVTLNLDGDVYNIGAGGLGISYVTYLGDPYLAYIYYTDGLDEPSRSRNTSKINPYTIYAQDDWTVGDRLTMNLGLRMDHWRTGFKGGPGLSNTPQTTDIAPRIGLNLDLLGDGRTSLNAFWGRFYEEFHGTTMNDFDPQAGTWWGLYYDGGVWYDWYRDDPTADVSFDVNLTNQYADQFVVGVDHQLTEDLAVTARYIQKDNKNILGAEDISTTFAPVTVTDDDGDTITLFNKTGGSRHRFLTNNPNESFVGESFREYKGYQFKLTKRMSNDWSMIASLLVQEARGNNFTDTGSMSHRDDPNDFIGYPGLSSNNRRYVSKIQGSYDWNHPIFGAQIGFIVNALAGGNWTRMERFQYFTNTAGEQERLGQRSLTVRIEEAGSQTLPSQFKIDLRIDKQFELNNAWGTLGLVFDIFNLTNDDSHVRVYSSRIDHTRFGEPSRIVQPRIFRMGVRWLF